MPENIYNYCKANYFADFSYHKLVLEQNSCDKQSLYINDVNG